VCDGCRQRLSDLLDGIVELYEQLPENLERGSNSGAADRHAGKPGSSPPLKVNILDLTMPARLDAVQDAYGDQVGHLSVATILESWVRDWREQRGLYT
jgi:hypothetical protein